MDMHGQYQYWMNGSKADITESFRFISTPGAGTVIESFRNAPAFGSRIQVTARYWEQQLKHFNVEWANSNDNAVRSAYAQYRFEEDLIHVDRDLDGRDFHEHLPRPQVFTVLPLLRVFTGRAIRQAHALGRGARVPVLVPNIADPADRVQLLALELSLRSVTPLGTETLIMEDWECSTDVFNFFGGNYDQTAKFWVDKNDLLLKYQWLQGNVFWEVKLTEISTQVDL